MTHRFLRRSAGRAVVALAMTAGVVGAAASVASANTGNTGKTGNNWYVATTGNNTANNCSTKSAPCATINYALSEQAAELVSGTVHVAAGTYTQQVAATSANDGVTIKGASAATTIIEPPASGLASDTDTDSGNPQFYIVDVGPGTTGFNVKDLSVNGLNASSFLDGDGDACAQDYVGIYYHAASGAITDVDLTGIDMPADLFGCQSGQGVYVNSTTSDPADVTMSGLSLTAASFESVTKADLPAGTYNRDILPVKKEPAGWTSGSVLVNGYDVSATADGLKDLFITGTTSTDSPKGSTVNYNALQPAFDKNGITCDDNWTTCVIQGSTIEGEGPNNQIAQNGIQAFGAESVTIGGPTQADGNTVSGDTWTGGGGSGNAAAGLELLNNGATTVDNNIVSDNDVDIYAGEIQVFGLVYPTPGIWAFNLNTVSTPTSDGSSAGEPGYGEGIQLDGTTNNVQVTDNTVSGAPSAGAGILLTGVSGATIGGLGTDQGNIVTGNGGDAGIVIGGPSTECEYAFGNSCSPGAGNPDQFSSTGNFIDGNSLTGNGIGAVVEGKYDPSLVGPADPDAAYSNSFNYNVWTSNLGANIADFSGYASTPPQNTYGPNDSCEPSAGGSASLNGATSTSGDYWAC